MLDRVHTCGAEAGMSPIYLAGRENGGDDVAQRTWSETLAAIEKEVRRRIDSRTDADYIAAIEDYQRRYGHEAGDDDRPHWPPLPPPDPRDSKRPSIIGWARGRRPESG